MQRGERAWQAAMGAVTGSLVAEAIALGDNAWGPLGERAIAQAEAMLRGAPVPIDLVLDEAVAVAVGLAAAPAPLLIDAGTVELIDHVRARLDGTPGARFTDPRLAEAAAVVAPAPSFLDAVAAAPDAPSAALVGALLGLEAGIGVIPARLACTVVPADGRLGGNGRRYLVRLTERLLGMRRNDWFDARTVRGPREVLPGLWVANLNGAVAFARRRPDAVVLSLCDTEHRLGDHPTHLTFHLDDEPRSDANPVADIVVDDVLDEITAARIAGTPVLVHCRHGASRTGLILRLVLMSEYGLDPDAALTEAEVLWPHTSTYNRAWTELIARRHERAARARAVDV